MWMLMGLGWTRAWLHAALHAVSFSKRITLTSFVGSRYLKQSIALMPAEGTSSSQFCKSTRTDAGPGPDAVLRVQDAGCRCLLSTEPCQSGWLLYIYIASVLPAPMPSLFSSSIYINVTPSTRGATLRSASCVPSPRGCPIVPNPLPLLGDGREEKFGSRVEDGCASVPTRKLHVAKGRARDLQGKKSTGSSVSSLPVRMSRWMLETGRVGKCTF